MGGIDWKGVQVGLLGAGKVLYLDLSGSYMGGFLCGKSSNCTFMMYAHHCVDVIFLGKRKMKRVRF